MDAHAEKAEQSVDSSDSYLQTKLFLISLAYFFVIGANTLFKDLRDSIFMSVVGREYIWRIKPLAMILLIPAILFHSVLIDRIRRYQLLNLYTFLYGVFGLVFTYYIGHESIGISNTDTSPNRVFGWLIYFFIEGYTPFVVSVYWAFVNSVFNPKEAKNSYAYMISISKMGGMAAAGFAWIVLSSNYFTHLANGHVINHQLLLGVASLMLLAVPCIIYVLMKKVPGRFLHGYEAVYQVEKKRKHQKKRKRGCFQDFL